MKLRIAFLTTLLVACGSLGDPADPRLDDPVSPSNPALTVVEPTDAGAGGDTADSSDDVVALDSSTTDSADAACTSTPSIGHCLTHMATLCYETSFDDTAACAKSGQTSGWHLGPCDLNTRSGELRANGGCILNCQLSYSYPLGGGPSTEKSRADARTICEESGGTFVDVTTSPTIGSDCGAN